MPWKHTCAVRVCTETNFTAFSIRLFIKERLGNFSAMSISAALEGAHAGRLLSRIKKWKTLPKRMENVITTVLYICTQTCKSIYTLLRR
jgi:hypothetical protein